HGVAHAAGDAIVKLTAHQPAPRELEQRPPVATARPARQRGERLGQPRQRQLGLDVASLERRPGRMYALERPGVPVRPAQLTRERRRLRPLGGRLRSEEHTSELQSLAYLVCRLLLEKKKKNTYETRQRRR